MCYSLFPANFLRLIIQQGFELLGKGHAREVQVFHQGKAFVGDVEPAHGVAEHRVALAQRLVQKGRNQHLQPCEVATRVYSIFRYKSAHFIFSMFLIHSGHYLLIPQHCFPDEDTQRSANNE